MKSIRVTIDPLGASTVEAIGFAGVGCVEATKKIEAALGGEASVRVEKPEIYNTETNTETNYQQW